MKPSVPNLPYELLPPNLRRIAEHCGESIMWELWEHYAGGHVCVPIAPIHGHPLTELLGVPRCLELCRHFAGETLLIPKADAARIAVRNALIRTQRTSGSTNFQLARRYGLTERRIIDITHSPELEQPDLF